MNRHPTPRAHPRGAALLIVLAVLVLTVTACTILAQSAATAKLRGGLDSCAREADALLPAAEDPIQDWLESKSATVVLDVDADQPCITVLHDQWMLDDQTCELTITAWDQCGMVPWALLKSASPLRLALPYDALAPIDDVTPNGSTVPFGLDLLIEPEGPGAGQSPFPSAPVTTPVRYGEGESPASDDANPDAVNPQASPTIGGLVSTHNPTAKINVNTAPITLVESAMRTAGRGGIEQIIAARRAGKPAVAPPALGGSSTDRLQGMPRPIIVSSSDCWSFRIDIRVGSVRRSWWATYQPALPDRSRARKSSDHQWSCTQRLVISN